MSDSISASGSDATRDRYWRESMKPGYEAESASWYADNTRESIRDDSLRDGLIPTGAVVVNHTVPTTSSRGRYALGADFADLFRPELTAESLESAVTDWQSAHLSAGALARIQILRRGAVSLDHSVKVRFPNGEVRQMAAGPSSLISKGVIEEFTRRFCEQPAVIWLSESGAKVVARDDALAASIGLNIDASKLLPDIVLADLGPADPILVFVEVVATEGAMTTARRKAFSDLAASAGFAEQQIAFVTAYLDRARPEFKRTVPSIGWNTFAWFASEPANLLVFRESKDTQSKSLRALMA